jgi:3',5'-cyclic AMP phosphodiesterase CpdA
MTTILQISDTHFGTEQQPVLDALEDHVRKHGADLLILSGDITQRARREQFEAGQAYVQRLEGYGIPATLVIPGNHDIPLYNVLARFTSPYGNYKRYFGDNLEPTYEDDQLLVIGLNTTHPKRRKDGAITPEQIRRVVERLNQTSKDKLRMVVAHQPFGAMVLSDLSNLQGGAEDALSAWADAGLDLVMGGHIHLPYVLPLSDQYSNLSREIWIVQAGTAFSSRVRGSAPNSFNRLIVGEGESKCVEVERWDFIDECFKVAERFVLTWKAEEQALATNRHEVLVPGGEQ